MPEAFMAVISPSAPMRPKVRSTPVKIPIGKA
jgi:hypothetical protein